MQTSSGIILPDGVQTNDAPPAPVKCDHQDKRYMHVERFGCLMCECGAFVEFAPGSEIASINGGLQRDGRLIKKATMIELWHRPPIVEMKTYHCGRFAISEMIIISGKVPQGYARFSTTVVVGRGDKQAHTTVFIHAATIEEAFDQLPRILKEVGAAGIAELRKEELTDGVAAAAAGIDMKRPVQRAQFQQRNGRSR